MKKPKNFLAKGHKPMFRNVALPNPEARRQLDKSQHTLTDYAKINPMTTYPTNIPITPSVVQFAAKGRKY